LVIDKNEVSIVFLYKMPRDKSHGLRLKSSNWGPHKYTHKCTVLSLHKPNLGNFS